MIWQRGLLFLFLCSMVLSGQVFGGWFGLVCSGLVWLEKWMSRDSKNEKLRANLSNLSGF